MGEPLLEECRYGEGMARGLWVFPDAPPPPHPLLVFGPWIAPALDAGPRPLDAAWALARRGLASFVAEVVADGPDLAAAWRQATRHPRASRARRALVLAGPAGPALGAALAAGCGAAAVVWLLPAGEPPPPGPDGLPLHLVFPPGDADATAEAHRADLAGELSHHGFRVSTVTLEGPAAGAPGTPALGPLVRALDQATLQCLRPGWERSARPPGTAIGDPA